MKATNHHMNIRRHLVLRATHLAVAFLASTAMAAGTLTSSALTSGAFATDPPPPTVPVPGDPTQPNDPSASSQIKESWTLAPSGSSDPSLAGNRPNLSYFSDPGAVIKDSVTVYNFGNVSETFRVYSTDAFNDAQGQFAVLAGDKTAVDVGSWVTFDQDNVTVLPGQQASFPITIKIPADAVPGDHVGAILASSPTIGTGQQGQVVTLDRRTGTRLYVRVNGKLNPDLAVGDVSTEYHQAKSPLGGSATVTFRIENHGNIRLSGTPSVAVGGVFGIGERKVTLPDISELLPGEQVTLTAQLTDVPAAMFDFTTVRVERHGSTDPGTTESTDTTFAPPLTLLLVLLPVVLLVLALRHRRRRTAHGRGATQPPAGAAPVRELANQSR